MTGHTAPRNPDFPPDSVTTLPHAERGDEIRRRFDASSYSGPTPADRERDHVIGHLLDQVETAEGRNQRALEFLRDGRLGPVTALLPHSLDAAVIRILEGGEPPPSPAPVRVSYLTGVSAEEIERAKQAVTASVAEVMAERQAAGEGPAASPEAVAVLCYVKEPWNRDEHQHRTAYFTTRNLADQWGDDWNDAPYDCNAGTPYLWDPEHDGVQRGLGRWSVFEVGFTGPFDTPAGIAFNTPFSVQDVNRGIVAWLWCDDPADERRVPEQIVVRAGVALDQFRELVVRAGGTAEESVELKHWREQEAVRDV